MEAHANPVSIAKTESYQWVEGGFGWHLLKSSALSVIQERMASGTAEVRHYHQCAEQFFYILAGLATMEVSGTTHVLSPQTGIHVPAGVVHQLSNNAADELVFLVMSTPTAHGDRILV